ncbi:hypothetical protein SPBR_02146 [Sporothrix brasiliensis 5110]|uniref:Uncharacterized protein n=1 Tax=Sporothrix brasiliensis 5110 TaxID=1398154 RepID=A0A0C2IQK5_9PEZI|nr:uncharacterized protein SPBR_02146 [Sporothrix brasiliensis 5110]KIH91321.1 hypothetical protein SPBR_02146 [Sporothrix brasiliensis 5110]
MADDKAKSGATETSNQSGQTTASSTHHNPGAEALRKAYAKYNVQPTVSNPAGVHHNVDQAPTDGATGAKDIPTQESGGGEKK